MTSRERMLASLSGAKPDYTPCSFMLFFNLHKTCRGEESFVERQLAMGLDAFTHVGYLSGALHPAAREKTWVETIRGEKIFHRRIDTPKGPLTQRVVQAEGWPTPRNFKMFNDWIVPRSREVLVKPEADLAKVPYIFGPFRDADIRKLRASAAVARRLARRHDILQVGGWSSINSSRFSDDGVMGVDAMAWLSGYVDIMTLALTHPGLIAEYARIIHEWNLRNLQIYLEVTDAELILRRAWYETTEFWTPAAYRAIIAPTIRKEAELVHQAGRKFGIIVTSAFLPLLDDMLATGIDVVMGVDPVEGKGLDLPCLKRKFKARRKAIWGGVSGAMTVEQGTARATEHAVLTALQTLAPGGGFILSPVDNVRDDTPRAWTNTRKFIAAWKRHRKEFIGA